MFSNRPGRAPVVITTIFAHSFAVYEIFSNHHFVRSSESLQAKHSIIIHYETNFSGFPNISQVGNGKDPIITLLF